MKHIFTLFLGLVLLSSCSKDKGGPQRSDISILSGAVVQLNGKAVVPRSEESSYSVNYVATYAVEFRLRDGQTRGFGELRDPEKGKLSWWPEDALREDLSLGGLITRDDYLDFVFEAHSLDGERLPWDHTHRYNTIERDTIAYIPNSVLIEARQKIRQAHAQERYEEVLRLFEEAFVFVPITGEQWRELKAQGKQ